MACTPAAAGQGGDLQLRLQWRPFRALLPQPLRTARGTLAAKQGWLLRLDAETGAVGWGEASPLLEQSAGLEEAIAGLPAVLSRRDLEQRLEHGFGYGLGPRCLAFALGAALAEVEGLPQGRWRAAPPGAVLLPAGEAALAALEEAIAQAGPHPLVLKWKVATHDDVLERQLLEQLLERLPATAGLRLDANGGWTRATAWGWAERLATEPRLHWLEQPLPPADPEGLLALARQLPVALDESLQHHPGLTAHWPSWQVRRPSQEGDPRPLLAALQRGTPGLMLSSSFETGIGRRWLEHLAALQWAGPTPSAPGLASRWQPRGPLAAADPAAVWQAAA
ncbi:enolase C-terminal domain-like protein [Cyanobium sp. NIES-981]|uniref:enolase C-terminal domain-like protein n=1 Tax=Cyanobium sp. NIES-981 TaxID=1851505 RepID=UPI000B35DB81|nr:enolase C-terminal domain-like protein [Cyanobium sp. NIES-981]